MVSARLASASKSLSVAGRAAPARPLRRGPSRHAACRLEVVSRRVGDTAPESESKRAVASVGAPTRSRAHRPEMARDQLEDQGAGGGCGAGGASALGALPLLSSRVRQAGGGGAPPPHRDQVGG